jgi:hypothetical protein
MYEDIKEKERERRRQRRRNKRATEEGKAKRRERMRWRRNHPNLEKREKFKIKRYRKQYLLRYWLYSIKKKSKCEICGFDKHPAALEFHHKNPLEKDIAICHLVKYKRNKEAILEELKKCILICANCHKILHFEESPWSEYYKSDDLDATMLSLDAREKRGLKPHDTTKLSK